MFGEKGTLVGDVASLFHLLMRKQKRWVWGAQLSGFTVFGMGPASLWDTPGPTVSQPPPLIVNLNVSPSCMD